MDLLVKRRNSTEYQDRARPSQYKCIQASIVIDPQFMIILSPFSMSSNLPIDLLDILRIIHIIHIYQMQAKEYVHEFYIKIKTLRVTNRKHICLVKNTLDGELCIAKLHQDQQTIDKHKRTVLHEGKFLQNSQGHLGIPFLHWAGKEEEKRNCILIVERLGRTLQEVYRQQKKPFSLKTVCQIGLDLIQMIASYHDKGYVHGNLKLSNIQFGIGKKSSQLYFNDLIDSVSYLRKGKHFKRQLVINKKTSIHQFMTFDRIQGYESSRRDDMESLLYMLIYLIKGELPWSRQFERLQQRKGHMNESLQQKSKLQNKQLSISKEQTTKEDTLKFKHTVGADQKITLLELKELENLKSKIYQTSVDDICKGVDCELKTMLIACKNLQYEQRPDYNSFLRRLRKILAKNDWDEDDRAYEWTISRNLAMKREQYQNLRLSASGQEEALRKFYLPFESKVEFL